MEQFLKLKIISITFFNLSKIKERVEKDIILPQNVNTENGTELGNESDDEMTKDTGNVRMRSYKEVVTDEKQTWKEWSNNGR